MRRSFAFLTFLALSSLPCAAAVSGTVTDRVGNGLSGVGVSLALAGTSTTTDAKGTWSLDPTGIDVRSITTSRTRWTGKAVELTLAEPATVSVEAYDLKGAQQGRLSRVKLGAGSHSLPLALSTSGVVWLRVTVNGRSEMVFGGIGMGGTSVRGAVHESLLQNPTAARSQGIGDTLLFTWKTRVVARVALSNLDTSGIVVKIDTDSSIAWQTGIIITYGSVYDARDGQVYRTAKIGEQVWMAENLNYSGVSGTTGVCYDNSTDSCRKYGRLYTWAEVMHGAASSETIPSGVQGICPSGWHVPSDLEWNGMAKVVDWSNARRGTMLKSTSSWSDTGNGTDIHGFRALPGGAVYGVSNYLAGVEGLWWSATEEDAANALAQSISNSAGVGIAIAPKGVGFSLRCLEDYTILAKAAMPTFSSVTGSRYNRYKSAPSVTLSTTTSGASIYYTVDGSAPTTSSTLYNGAITVSTSETINAIAVKNGMTTSSVHSEEYTINSYGSVTDAAGQAYKTVKIGSQWWIAENLNYAGTDTSVGVCYNNDTDYCKEYGRLYTWAEVMAGHVSSTASPSGVQGICPTGWHVPSDSEWTTMQNDVEFSYYVKAGTELKSTSGWYSGGNGTDTYGFRALPGGDVKGGSFDDVGYDGYWWSSTSSWGRSMHGGDPSVQRDYDYLEVGRSLRCLEDYPGAVSSPIFSPVESIRYKSAQSVTLSSTTSGASIFYTVDGSTPTTSSTAYSGAITVSFSQAINAIAVKSGMTNSSVTRGMFTIDDSSTAPGIPWENQIRYEGLTYGGQIYKTVKIGFQWWMAENLNYSGVSGSTGVCYNNSADSCKKYGRLYTWAEVMNGARSSPTSPSGVQGICPSGWHVPSDAEWTTMQNFRDDGIGGYDLRSTSGWSSRCSGGDNYGFRALPGGNVGSGSSYNAGSYGYWWSATEGDAASTWGRYVAFCSVGVYRSGFDKAYGVALRCVED